METPPLRKIRSFVRREGRMSQAQKHALQAWLPEFEISGDGPLDLDACFGRPAPRFLEVGFGMGHSLLAMAAAHPERDYLGIEVHRPGVANVLLRMQEGGIRNIRLMNRDAVEVLAGLLPEASLDGVYLFFPDPWPKKRHHKRRIVQPAMVHQVRRVLKPGGILHMATDWVEYADYMLAILRAAPGFINTAEPGPFADRGDRPPSKYEQRGLRLGHEVRDLRFRRV